MYYLFAIFRQNKKYWVWRSRLVRYAYFFYKIGFKVRKGANESVEGYVEVRSLFSSVQLSVFVAIAFALGLWLLDRWMTNFYELANIHVPVVSDYVSLLSGIAGVAGVFIGLYYAAIGGVVSAVYSKAPPSIRTAFSERMYGGGIYAILVVFNRDVPVSYSSYVAHKYGLSIEYSGCCCVRSVRSVFFCEAWSTSFSSF